MKTKFREIIVESLEEVNLVRDTKIDLTDIDALTFYGTNGVFSSLGLVNFLSTVEEKLEDECDLEFTLTSEKAISRKVSPFTNIQNLIGFIEELHSEILVE